MQRLAIIGSGVAGLSLAYYLRDKFDLTLFEKDDRAGGHAHTVIVPEASRRVPVDTGFMVFNHATYPNLIRLFEELGVPTKKTDMSFSVQHLEQGLEYSGASLNRLFGDRKNIFRDRFWKMLFEIDRFNKQGLEIAQTDCEQLTLLEFVRKYGYGQDFLDCYIVPMSGAIWSTPPEKMLNFPILTLLRFFQNHGLLGVSSQHQWWTVEGGSKQYVDRILQHIPGMTCFSSKVISVKRTDEGVAIICSDGQRRMFDKVAIACHADEALQILESPNSKESSLLGAFSYQRNETLLHTDSCVMPKQKRCWSSWNYRLDGHGSSTHYWMNKLQNVSDEQEYFVTLNGEHLVDLTKIIKRMTYHHPLFDMAALKAQKQLPSLNETSHREQVFFCGSYFGYGFHEDALKSSLDLAKILTEKSSLCMS